MFHGYRMLIIVISFLIGGLITGRCLNAQGDQGGQPQNIPMTMENRAESMEKEIQLLRKSIGILENNQREMNRRLKHLEGTDRRGVNTFPPS